MRSKTYRNPPFAGEFLEKKLSPSGGLSLLPAEVSVIPVDEPQRPRPTYPYPPINGEPPLFPPLIPGGPLGPG